MSVFTKLDAFCENTESIEDLVFKMNNDTSLSAEEKNMIAGIYSYVVADDKGLSDESSLEEEARLLASLGGQFDIEKAVYWAKEYKKNEEGEG